MEALDRCKKEFNLPVSYRSMNQGFKQICQVAAEHSEAIAISGEELQSTLYSNNPSLSRNELRDAHYFALAQHLDQAVLVMEGEPVSQCIAYVGGSKDGEQPPSRYVIKERDPSSSNEGEETGISK